MIWTLLTRGFLTFDQKKFLFTRMYSTAKSYGGVKGRAPQAGTGKRKLAAKAALSAARAAARAQNAAVQAASLQTAATMRFYRNPRIERKWYSILTGITSSQALYCANNGALAVSGAGNWYQAAGPTTAGAAVINHGLSQGTGVSMRIGRKIRLTGVHLRGYFIGGNTAIANPASLSLIYHRNPNNPSAMPAFTDIWMNQTYTSQRNVDNEKELKILRRIEAPIAGSSAAVTCGRELQCVDEFVDLSKKSYETEWGRTDTTGDYTVMERGALYLYGLGITATGAAAVQFVGAWRIYYEDV